MGNYFGLTLVGTKSNLTRVPVNDNWRVCPICEKKKPDEVKYD